MSSAPVLFISHGAPTFALEAGRLGPRLGALGRALSGIEAVLVVSPHWQTRDIAVTTSLRPETIHDFGGFPPPLYELRYPAPGAPTYAAAALQRLAEAGLPARPDPHRGLDHGAWVPLLHLLPEAQIPVFQVSMPVDLDTRGALQLGRALAPLREQGVLIIGSGSLTHNLYDIRHSGPEATYAREFADWNRRTILAGNVERLLDYRSLAPHAERAHPTDEHYLPLLVAMGARQDAETPLYLEGGITYSVLSMDSFGWGLPANDSD